MSEDQLIHWIQNIGFPIAVAAYVLIRLDGTLSKILLMLTQIHGTLYKATNERLRP